MEITFNISDILHPHYRNNYMEWVKWRDVWESGFYFLRKYLKRSNIEDPSDFEIRRDISYVAAFAKSAVVEVRNSIYQRLTDITRDGGTNSYKEAVAGLNGGVD